jgi:hypothetical protein
MDITPGTKSNSILISISQILPLGLFLGASDTTDCVVLRKVTEINMFCFPAPMSLSTITIREKEDGGSRHTFKSLLYSVL